MMRRLHLLLAGLVFSTATGCASLHTQMARTNGAGRVQVGVEPGVSAIGLGRDRAVLPSMALAARVGLTDTIDVGARLGPADLELQSKFLLTDPDRYDLAVSLAPAVSGTAADLVGLGPLFVRTTLPVLVDRPIGPHVLVVAGRTSLVVAPAEARGLNKGFQLSVGASAGIAVRFSEAFALLPDLGVDVPVAGRATALPGARAPQVSFRLGVLFGGPKRAERGGEL